jgi:hypothetical protein
MSLLDLIPLPSLKTVAAWGMVLAGLSLLSWLMVVASRRPAKLSSAPVKARQPGRCPHRDWELTTAIARTWLAQADGATQLHARASQRIDAAEYALNRLLGECATVMRLPLAPTLQPVPALARDYSPFSHQQLAA